MFILFFFFFLQYDSLDLEKLKARPAHMGVFMRYIFSQAEADPNPLVALL